MNYTEEVIKALVVAASLGVGAWGVKVVRCMVSTLKKVDAALPTLLKVADEMKPNGGSSLRDRVDKIMKQLTLQEHARRTLIDLFDDGAFFECDPDGKYLYVNRAWCNLTGLSLNDASGDGWIAGIHPDDREWVVNEWASCIEHAREFDLAYSMIDTDKTPTRVHTRTRILRSEGGDVIGIIGVSKVE